MLILIRWFWTQCCSLLQRNSEHRQMKSIVRYFSRLLSLGMDYLVVVVRRSSVKTGVVLIKLDAIGDFIIWLDAAKEHRRLYPNQKLTLIANATWADLARGLVYWDEVWPIDLLRFMHKPFYRWTMLRKIGQANFETAIQPTFSRVLMHGDSVMRATHASQRIGSVGDLCNITARDKALSDRWYTRLVPASLDPLMELQRNAEFINHLIDKSFKACLPKLPGVTALPKRLQPQGSFFILFPGASWNGKQWPPQYFVEVGVQLHRRYGWQAVLCGSPAERGLCQSIADAAKTPCLNFAGQTTLAELAALILGAQLVLANETSAVHLAAAVRTPAVCILGGGHFGRFMPYPDTLVGLKPLVAAHPMACFNCNWHCNQPHDPAGPVPCVSEISIELVMSRAIHAIEQSPKFSQ